MLDNLTASFFGHRSFYGCIHFSNCPSRFVLFEQFRWGGHSEITQNTVLLRLCSILYLRILNKYLVGEITRSRAISLRLRPHLWVSGVWQRLYVNHHIYLFNVNNCIYLFKKSCWLYMCSACVFLGRIELLLEAIGVRFLYLNVCL